MNPTANNPSERRTWLFAALPAALLLLPLAARFVIERQLPFPRCVLLQFTGVPCPTCGGTRSLAALAEFDLATALAMNPLIFAACVAALLVAADQLISRLFRRPALLGRMSAALPGAWLWTTLAVAAVANWIYLCLTLPR